MSRRQLYVLWLHYLRLLVPMVGTGTRGALLAEDELARAAGGWVGFPFYAKTHGVGEAAALMSRLGRSAPMRNRHG